MERTKKDDLDVGDEVVATFAPEKFAPIQFHSFDIGPFIAKTKVREGETGEEAMQRAYNVARNFARKTFPEKRDEFFDRVDAADEECDRRAGRNKKGRG